MFVVVELHRGFVDVGLQGGVIVGKWWDFVGQSVPPWFVLLGFVQRVCCPARRAILQQMLDTRTTVPVRRGSFPQYFALDSNGCRNKVRGSGWASRSMQCDASGLDQLDPSAIVSG